MFVADSGPLPIDLRSNLDPDSFLNLVDFTLNPVNSAGLNSYKREEARGEERERKKTSEKQKEEKRGKERRQERRRKRRREGKVGFRV